MVVTILFDEILFPMIECDRKQIFTTEEGTIFISPTKSAFND